jgi:hypothetical protein
MHVAVRGIRLDEQTISGQVRANVLFINKVRAPLPGLGVGLGPQSGMRLPKNSNPFAGLGNHFPVSSVQADGIETGVSRLK